MINLVIPMAGRGSRFSKQGYTLPKPLVELDGKPFFWWAIESVRRSIEISELICVVLKEHVVEHDIIQQVHHFYPQAKFVVLDKVTDGALDTAMCGLTLIDNDFPVIFNDCDQAFEIKHLPSFISQMAPGGDVMAYLCNFESDSPAYSYALYENERLVKTAEKIVISRFAISGAYIFANKRVVTENYALYKQNCSYDEIFISGIYNTLCDQGYTVKGILLDNHLSFGTPEELKEAEHKKLFHKWL
ncbi:NTP transferase domain-containing protein [Kosakonia sp. ML.JS2a]|uniref:NTP transferase domain-containing protein n=1 Tax=Kosakonia sp. ML.JS2a TaxID=2980557 RepID=UPI0021D8099D|nr:NTP transferase domain-containing protein [Kosakonia sp. ML.JS2a]UXY12636.1 NTP transferase domain-containing protein [Kosakonia sp. ML.JS2a]